MRFDTLDQWLRWQEGLHPNRIELGLERIRPVAERLGVTTLACPVITVGGTNGKGSTVALLDAIYRAGGYRVGRYTSPHLLRYNERICIDGVDVTDRQLCQAFERVDEARGRIQLTFFEFGTLAALDLFAQAGLDLVILEVGLGGRLDAVNLVDADVAVVSGIARDHTAWLGDDLDSIAFEKAGIFRRGRPALIGQRTVPDALCDHAQAIGAEVLQLGREYDWTEIDGGWRWQRQGRAPVALPVPGLRGDCQYDNAALACTAVDCLEGRLPVSTGSLRRGLQRVELSGRFQVLPGAPAWILDVAHNPQAAESLAANLRSDACLGRLHAIFGILADKEVGAVVKPLLPLVDSWYLTQPADLRAMPVDDLAALFEGVEPVRVACTEAEPAAAMAQASSSAAAGDCILVFGSFSIVEAALRRYATFGPASV